MKRLFASSAVFYCLGILLVSLVRINFWLILSLGIITLAVACLSFRNNRKFIVLIFFLSLLLGGLNLKNSYLRSKCHISNFVRYKDNAVISLNGFVDNEPVIKNRHTFFVFRAQEAQVNNLKWPCCGKVLVKVDFSKNLSYAERLTIIGTLRQPFGFSPSSRSYRDYLSRQEIYLVMHIKNSLQIIPQLSKGGPNLIIFSLWLRTRMEQVISRYLPDLSAGILSAMVLGQRRTIPWLVNNSMVKSGTVHILVVSGFNVGIVVFIVNLLLKIMRIQRKARIILTIICVFIYCLITGASNPVIRATVMGVIFLLAYLLKREPDMYNCLASAALFILIINPRQLFDVGFQLSFASVLAIVYSYSKLKSFLRIDNCKIKILKFIAEGCLVSFCAWLGTIGIIAYNFRIIAPVTVLANILIVPLATLITLCGFSLILCGSFCPFLGGIFSTTTGMLITLLLNINAAVIKIPGAYFYF
jgi:competence protein ComEC